MLLPSRFLRFWVVRLIWELDFKYGGAILPATFARLRLDRELNGRSAPGPPLSLLNPRCRVYRRSSRKL